jgi:hypothetical protein
MLIEIIIPIFKCKEDKNVFLSRLSGLPNFVKVDVEDFKYYLTLADSEVEIVINELQKICEMWGVKFNIVSE